MIGIRNRSAWGVIVLTMLANGTVACAGKIPNQAAEPAPETRGALHVVNRSSVDMDIYLVHGGQRVRLGLAPGNQTTEFALTPAQVVGAGSLQFEAVPLAGLGRAVSSEPTTVAPGEVITLDIPPL